MISGKINKKRKEGDSEQFVHGDGVRCGKRRDSNPPYPLAPHPQKREEKPIGSSSRPARQEKNTVGNECSDALMFDLIIVLWAGTIIVKNAPVLENALATGTSC